MPLPEITAKNTAENFNYRKGSLYYNRNRLLDKNGKNTKPQTSRIDYQKKFANLQYGKISEYGYTPNQIFATFLRNSEQFKSIRTSSQGKSLKKNLEVMLAENKAIKKKEKKWNQRFALPI